MYNLSPFVYALGLQGACAAQSAPAPHVHNGCAHACRWLGVEHVYLTENSNPPPEDMVPQLQDFIDSGFLTFRAVARPEFQVMFYRDCMEHHRHKHNWMAFIDLDEFIVLRKCALPRSRPCPPLRTKYAQAR